MRWFKHMNDMLDDVFVNQLVNEFGPAGFGIWCGILETYAKYEKGNVGDFVQIPWDALTYRLRTTAAKLRRILEYCEEHRKIISRPNPNCIEVKIPKMADLSDEWTARKKNRSGVSLPKTTEIDPDTDKDPDIEKLKDNTHTDGEPVSVSSEKILKKHASQGHKYFDSTKPFGAMGYKYKVAILDEFRGAHNRRPELSPEQILDAWKSACDIAIRKEAKSFEFYKITFRNKLSDKELEVKSMTKPKPKRPSCPLERLKEDCQAAETDQVEYHEPGPNGGKIFNVLDLEIVPGLPGVKPDMVRVKDGTELWLPGLKPWKPTAFLGRVG